MKLIAQLSLLTILLAACAAPPADMPAASPAPSTQTVTPSATASPALDLTPFDIAQDEPETPTPDTPDTPTITPLPTIPTFTPTFDARTIVTATPAPRAECPVENPELIPDFPYCDATGCSGGPYSDATLIYLKSGGTLDKLESRKWGVIIDLTGDGLKEVAFAEYGKLYIYGCEEGRFTILTKIEGTQNTPSLDYIVDLNKNGIPELLFSNYERRAFRSIQVIEWNGSKFKPLIKNEFVNSSGNLFSFDWLGGTGLDYQIKDINRDGVDEIIAVDLSPIRYDPNAISELPWRDVTITLGWNGQNYVIADKKYAPPQHRFQAIQDADRLTLIQNYSQAIQHYQDAIFNDHLEWWSKDRKFYESETLFDNWFQRLNGGPIETPVSPLPTPIPDPGEYPRLAAYAYYRMIILHTFLGEMDAAQVKYATLQEKFPAGSPGHPYVEMATDFWNAYQSSGRMYDACAAAIAYADSQPEILVPLGSDYHGAQSHRYQPADVCPFR
jgi:hypothetical protein